MRRVVAQNFNHGDPPMYVNRQAAKNGFGKPARVMPVAEAVTRRFCFKARPGRRSGAIRC